MLGGARADNTSSRQLENHFSHRSFVSLLSGDGPECGVWCGPGCVAQNVAPGGPVRSAVAALRFYFN